MRSGGGGLFNFLLCGQAVAVWVASSEPPCRDPSFSAGGSGGTDALRALPPEPGPALLQPASRWHAPRAPRPPAGVSSSPWGTAWRSTKGPVPPYSWRNPGRSRGPGEASDGRTGRAVQERAPHFEVGEIEAQRGVTFPRSHGKTAAEVPQGLALRTPVQ